MRKSRGEVLSLSISSKTKLFCFILHLLLLLIFSGNSKANPSPRSLHFIKDVNYTTDSKWAKFAISFDGPVTYKILERRYHRSGKSLTLRIENCVMNPRIERVRPDKKFVTWVSIKSDHSGKLGSAVIITISYPKDVDFDLAESNNPFRIVATFTRKPSQPGNSVPIAESTQKSSIKSETKPSTPVITPEAKPQLQLIVIDPGHGGHDKGATGWKGVYEKDLTLKLATSLKRIIEESIPQVKVELTRNCDEYLSLEQRVKIANTLKADLFISLHFNAHENPAVRGIETYYLNVSQDKEAARVAAIENAVLKKKMTDLEAILQDLLKASSIAESSKLARTVHNHIVESLKTLSPDIRDLGVKSAPFYVLFGTTMPSILIEAGFISNKDELDMINSTEFSRAIASGIVQGVKLYATHTVDDYQNKTGAAGGMTNGRVMKSFSLGH